MGPVSHRGHQDQGFQRKHESSHSQHLPLSALPSDNTIWRITDAFHDHAPHQGYQHPEVPDAGNEYFGQPQGRSGVNDLLGSTTNLGAVGNAPNVPPPPTQPRDQSLGCQMYGVGSDLQGYYPEEFNTLTSPNQAKGFLLLLKL